MPNSFPLPVGSYALPDPRASCRRLINCFAQAAPATPQLGPNPTDTKQQSPPVTLARAWGITGFANDGTSNGVRGMNLFQGTVYAVIGPSLYTMDVLGNLTKVATGIHTAAGTGAQQIVHMANNTQCLVILIPNSTIAYTYTPGGGLATITAPLFTSLGALDMGFIDTFIVFLQQNGLGFFNDDGQAVSGTGPITFTSGSQFLREFGVDPFVTMSILNRTITMLGSQTGETYINAGNTVGSPFGDAPDGFLEIGAATNYLIGRQDQANFFVANDLTIRRLSGQTPIRVSNHGVEAIFTGGGLETAADLSNAYALSFSYMGHLFFAVTMPNSGRTVVLDVTTGEFHELSSSSTPNGNWRPLCTLRAYGKQLVGDSLSGQIGFLDPMVGTEFGAPQIMRWTHQPVYMANKYVSHRRVELCLGAGFAPVYGTSPKITMFISDDGGLTFRAGQTKSLGMKGEYKDRVVWTNLGSARQRVYAFQFSDSLVATWVPDALIDAVPGNA